MPPTAAATISNKTMPGKKGISSNQPRVLETSPSAGKEDSPVTANKKADSKILSVEGIMVLIIAIMFDMLGLFCGFLVWAFGIGAVLGRFVSAAGMVVFTVWAAIRGSDSPGNKGRDEAQSVSKKVLQRFLKKHWKKLGIEACPVLGDFAPTFLMMWYSEFK